MKFKKIAADLGLGLPPMPAGDPLSALSGGMPGMPGLPGMGMPPVGLQQNAQPTEPMSAKPDRPSISTGLDSLGKILYDANVQQILQDEISANTEDIAMKIWTMYGGTNNGEIDPSKKGTRGTEPLDPNLAKKEKEITENNKWKRLPQGKNIGDITSLDEIDKAINGLSIGNIVKENQEAAAPPAGAPPMLAKIIQEKLIKIANTLDNMEKYQYSDTIDNVLNIIC